MQVFLLEDDERRGLFHGSWQNDTEEIERLEPTEEQAAIEWGRARSERVVIRLVETMSYSAGAANPWDAPEWPGLAEARAHPHATPPPD